MSIEDRWQEFKQDVLGDATEAELKLHRRTFFAGAAGTMMDTLCAPRGMDEQIGKTYAELELHSIELQRPAMLN